MMNNKVVIQHNELIQKFLLDRCGLKISFFEGEDVLVISFRTMVEINPGGSSSFRNNERVFEVENSLNLLESLSPRRLFSLLDEMLRLLENWKRNLVAELFEKYAYPSIAVEHDLIFEYEPTLDIEIRFAIGLIENIFKHPNLSESQMAKSLANFARYFEPEILKILS